MTYFCLVKDIDEWNNLSIKNNIKKKRSKIEEEISQDWAFS